MRLVSAWVWSLGSLAAGEASKTALGVWWVFQWERSACERLACLAGALGVDGEVFVLIEGQSRASQERAVCSSCWGPGPRPG